MDFVYWYIQAETLANLLETQSIDDQFFFFQSDEEMIIKIKLVCQ